LRDDLKRGNISAEEESIIVKMHASFGNRLAFNIFSDAYFLDLLPYFGKPIINPMRNYVNFFFEQREIMFFFKEEIMFIESQKFVRRN